VAQPLSVILGPDALRLGEISRLAGRLHEIESSGKDGRVGAVSLRDHALNLITRDQLDFHPLLCRVGKEFLVLLIALNAERNAASRSVGILVS
jgi:hypothetical protein